MITYAVEDWFRVLPELEAHWPDHYAEVARDQDKIPLAPDYEAYAVFASSGALHVVTVRERGLLIGYLVAIIKPHLHYRTTLMAFFDLYYLAKGKRRGWAGVRLFQEAERSLRARGVKKMFTGTKLHRDASAIFRRLAWVEAERLHSKWIGD